MQPFRFPATFTFVVRSFTVLDGIGKGLNPRFDISEIAAPYARGCAPSLRVAGSAGMYQAAMKLTCRIWYAPYWQQTPLEVPDLCYRGVLLWLHQTVRLKT